MTNRTYLDQNVFVAIVKNERPGLLEHIDKRKAEGVQFPYSPAHIEEVAVILRDHDDPEDPEPAHRLIGYNLWLIGHVSGGLEILPPEDVAGPSRYVQEEPQVCFQRVIGNYGLTLSAEEITRHLKSYKSAEIFDQVQQEMGSDLRAGPGTPLFETRRRELGIDPQKIGNLSETKLFDDPAVKEGLRQKLWGYTWNLDTFPQGAALAESFSDRRNVLTAVMNYLDEIGYRSDDFDKYRSGMHDVTHSVYAAAADVFVTGDKRYRQRVKAAYHLLGIPTKVLSIEEFMAAS